MTHRMLVLPAFPALAGLLVRIPIGRRRRGRVALVVEHHVVGWW